MMVLAIVNIAVLAEAFSAAIATNTMHPNIHVVVALNAILLNLRDALRPVAGQ